MSCIKTGANVLFPEWSIVVHGDLFKVGECYLLQFTQGGFYNGSRRSEAECDAVMHIGSTGYLHQDRGVACAPEAQVDIVP